MKFFLNFLFASLICQISFAQSSIYGVSMGGGMQDKGTIFKVDSNGNNLSIIYQFKQKNRSANPTHSAFTLINNQIYGITYEGGIYSGGTIYKFNYLTRQAETVYDFVPQESAPIADLVLANNGLYYGLSEYGGVNGYGILYSFNPSTNSITTVYSFSIDEMPNSIVHYNGSLFFFSEYGGVTNEGDISKYDLTTNAFTVLHSFDSSVDLAVPTSHIFFDGVSKIYGTCKTDPNNTGGIFTYDVISNNYQIDTFLTITKGFYSESGFIKMPNGLMYSTTQKGGNNYILNPGTIYSFNPSTKKTTQLFMFSLSDGYKAAGNLVPISSSEFVGYTEKGGLNDFGVLYKFNILSNTYTKLFDFTSACKNPTGSLFLKDSIIYGNYSEDDNINNTTGSPIGGIFMFNLNSLTFSQSSFFTDEGVNPSGGIINIGAKIYGMTAIGGAHNCGTIYTYDLGTGIKKDIYNFPTNSLYNTHRGRLIKANNGNLYGTSLLGGVSNYGYIFEVNPITDSVIVKYNFNQNYNAPLPDMTLASDGNFYGICTANGPVLGGALTDARNAFYKFDYTTNTVSILEHVYISGSNYFDGGNFNGGMIELGNSLQFIGTCSTGGQAYMSCVGVPMAGGPGLVFKFDGSINHYSVYFDNRCQSKAYEYPDEACNMLYLNQDSIYLINTADIDYVSGLGRIGRVVHINANTNTYTEKADVGSINQYLSFMGTPLLAKNKNIYISSFNQTTPIIGYSNYYNGSLFEYNPYADNLTKKFDFDTYNIFSPYGGFIEINDTIIHPHQDVWPGDANSDGVADNLDILELGLHFTQTGLPRASISNNWQAYYATNWNNTISNGKNLNHSDCNGDGIIDMNDTLAIYDNYNLTHSFKQNYNTTSNPQLRIIPNQSLLLMGYWGSANIYIGDSLNQINDINGLAFTINFNNTLIETDSVFIEYTTSFIDPVGQNLKFRKLDFSNGNIYTASTHTSNINVTGYGLIAKLHYKIKFPLVSSDTLSLSILNCNKSNNVGNIIPLTSGSGTVTILNSVVATQNLMSKSVLTISPNPAMNQININNSEIIKTVELVDITGGIVLNEKINHTQCSLNVTNVTSGVYFLRVSDLNNYSEVRKIIIQK